MLKNSKFAVAMTMLAQSVIFFVLFIITCCKKKSIAGAFLALSAVEGAAGLSALNCFKKEVASTVVDMGEELEMDDATINDSIARHDTEA